MDAYGSAEDRRASSPPPLTEEEELLLCGVELGTSMAKWVHSIRLQLRDRTAGAAPYPTLLPYGGGRGVHPNPLQIPASLINVHFPAVPPMPSGSHSGPRHVRRAYDGHDAAHEETAVEVSVDESALPVTSSRRSASHNSESSNWLVPSVGEAGIATKVYRDQQQPPRPRSTRSQSLDMNDRESIQRRLQSLKKTLRDRRESAVLVNDRRVSGSKGLLPLLYSGDLSSATGSFRDVPTPVAAPPSPLFVPFGLHKGSLPPIAPSPVKRRRKSKLVKLSDDAQHRYWIERTKVVVMSLGEVEPAGRNAE